MKNANDLSQGKGLGFNPHCWQKKNLLSNKCELTSLLTLIFLFTNDFM